MTDKLQKQLVAALRHLLRPVVRVLLRHGLAFGDLAEIIKGIYVEVARDNFTPDNRRPTDSRIAILTGLTRKDVKRLREDLESGIDDTDAPADANDAHRATRVLSGWHQDPDFCDQTGHPIELKIDGAAPSFAALVKRYSGDMPVRAMLDELIRVGAITESNDGMLTVKSRTYIPSLDNPQGIRMFGTALHDLASTIDHNLSRSDDEPTWLQRSASNHSVDPRAVPILRRVASEQGQALLEQIDDWMSSHELADSADVDPAHVGIGIYFFEREKNTDNGDDNNAENGQGE